MFTNLKNSAVKFYNNENTQAVLGLVATVVVTIVIVSVVNVGIKELTGAIENELHPEANEEEVSVEEETTER